MSDRPRPPQEGPPLRRRRRAPEGHDGQPGGLADRGRGHRHHRGQGQGPAARRREVRHQGQEGDADEDRSVHLQRQVVALHPGQGHGPQAVRRDRAPLRRPRRRVHPHPQARARATATTPPWRASSSSSDRAGGARPADPFQRGRRAGGPGAVTAGPTRRGCACSSPTTGPGSTASPSSPGSAPSAAPWPAPWSATCATPSS